jgi:hypothetical protein
MSANALHRVARVQFWRRRVSGKWPAFRQNRNRIVLFEQWMEPHSKELECLDDDACFARLDEIFNLTLRRYDVIDAARFYVIRCRLHRNRETFRSAKRNVEACEGAVSKSATSLK